MIRVLATMAAIAGALFVQGPESRVQRSESRVHIEAVVERIGDSFVGGKFVSGLAFVGGLTRDDFIVTVDDREVPIEACVVDDSPITVVVMIDITASTMWPGVSRGGDVERALNDELLAQFRNEDRVRFASFARRVVMANAFTTNRRLARQGLVEAIAPRENERTGPSPIWDALDAALTVLEPEPGRRAVILITDGKSTGNHKNLSEVADRAIALGIPISTVSVGGPMLLSQTSDQIALVRPGLALERLSVTTGGLAVEMRKAPPTPGQPSPLTASVIALQQAYRISIATGLTDGRFHTVSIRTRDASYQVRARAAFLAARSRP